MTDLEFFNFHWEGLEGKAVIALLDSNRNPTKQKFFSWPEQATDLLAHVEANADKDVYFSPTLFSTPRAQRVAAKVTRTVQADADTFNVEDALLEPSMIVHTSEGKTHLYWQIEDIEDPLIIERMSHGVSAMHDKAETGLDTGWHINKLLRVPGTSNTKYSDPKSEFYVKGAEPFTITYELTGMFYDHEEFVDRYPEVETVQVAFREMGEIPSKADALSAIGYSTQLDQLLSKHFYKGTAGSEALYLLYAELFRLGATEEQVFAICKDSPLNKFKRDGKSDDHLWNDILRCKAKDFSEEVGHTDYEEAEVEATIVATPKPKEIDFLTTEEKNSLPTTFVDEYVGWATTKTDANPEFHIAGAFTILSLVFSDFGHAVPKFGRLPLNLWFMVLGETTRSRKSTSRNLMLSVIDAMASEPDEEGAQIYNYDLGSDFTMEALANALHEKSNRAALIHRDEIQSFLREADSKAYMAGVKGSLTELYDGKVSGKLRATGDKKKIQASNVSFCFFAMGIRDQLADYLTIEDFQSGFLTRFVYVEAEAPPRTAESDALEQATPDEVKEGDPLFKEMVDKLEASRGHWEEWLEPSSPTTPVPCKPEAWARLNKFISDVLDEAEGYERHQIIEASSQRLTLSILKAATLMAMYDCKDEVELEHMLAAIHYCSTWFVHMVSMADRISASAWKRRLDKLQEYLLTKGGISTYESAYNHFKSEIRPREFVEIVQALEESGMLSMSLDGKKKRILSLVGM